MEEIKQTVEGAGINMSFRCPDWLLKQIDRKIMEHVLRNSNDGKLFKYTRTDLIIDSIINWNSFEEMKEDDHA